MNATELLEQIVDRAVAAHPIPLPPIWHGCVCRLIREIVSRLIGAEAAVALTKAEDEDEKRWRERTASAIVHRDAVSRISRPMASEPLARMIAAELDVSFARGWGARLRAEADLRERLQLKCREAGAYWRSGDGHGVQLSPELALELLRDALGVEVEILRAGAGGLG